MTDAARPDISFGPPYPKIHSLWKRDEKGIVQIGQYSEPEVEYLADKRWRWTEKVDGTNIRLHYDGRHVTIGGRTDRAQLPTDLIEALRPYADVDIWRYVFDADCDDVTIYGEGYGAGIQKGGGNYRPDKGLIVFDVKVGPFWLHPSDVADVAFQFPDLDVVPEIGQFSVNAAWSMVATGDVNSYWPDVTIEGLVGRPLVDLYNRRGERLTVKVKGKDFADHKAQQKRRQEAERQYAEATA